MEAIIELSTKKIKNTSFLFQRALINEIDWNDRLISIVRGRGAGNKN